MRAVRFHDWGQAPVLDEVPEPVPAPGEVLIQVQAGAVAHLDATVAGGDFGFKPQLPYIAGVEGAGLVLQAPADSGLTAGQQVVLRGAGLGIKRDGTWTERIAVPVKAAHPLAAPLAPETAATFFVPATTAFVVLNDIARLQPGEEVIVVGAAGTVGAMVVQQALAVGASVTGIVGRADQLAQVPKGARALDASDQATTERLAVARSASLLVDTLGGEKLVERTRWVQQGGRAVIIGYVAGTQTGIDLPSWLLDDVALLPVNMIRRERRAREVAPQLVEQLSAGTLQVEVERFPLAETAQALAAMRAGRVRGRAVVLP